LSAYAGDGPLASSPEKMIKQQSREVALIKVRISVSFYSEMIVTVMPLP
jgi:hypothetical protein